MKLYPIVCFLFLILIFILQGKKLPPNIDENAEEGDVSDEDSADEMEDDCKLMNGDVSSMVPKAGFVLPRVLLFVGKACHLLQQGACRFINHVKEHTVLCKSL